jgi:hypothetical protein
MEIGLKIYLDKHIKDRILLSDGIQQVDTLNGQICKSKVFIAKKPWRLPTENESDILIAKKNDLLNYQIVGILNLPSDLKNKFKNLKLDECKNYNEITKITNTEIYKNVLKDTIEYFEKSSLEKKSSIPHNIYLGEPNLTNNTFNQKEQSYIGLHLDSWEARYSDSKEKARNRICINLGKEPRYLLFYNLQFNEMAKMCGVTEMKRNDNPYEMLYKFFDIYKSYPVIKIKINPYEVYLAPTENIIHDGSTEGTVNKDLNLAIRGFFKIPIKQNFFYKTF